MGAVGDPVRATLPGLGVAGVNEKRKNVVFLLDQGVLLLVVAHSEVPLAGCWAVTCLRDNVRIEMFTYPSQTRA